MQDVFPGAIEMANFFMDDTVPVNLDRFYQIRVEEMISPQGMFPQRPASNGQERR